ncbi:diguanylate cyclase [Halomonas denitrificans]|nr:diguanylate cyclase [Halomonas denitrificans]
MKVRAKVTILFSFLLTAAIANTYFIFSLDQEGEEKRRRVAHTHEVILESERLLGHLVDAETGQRGYLLTANAAYLAPYHRALSAISTKQNRLSFLTANDLQQQALLQQIDRSIALQLQELKATIELNAAGEQTIAMKVMSLNQGKYFMDDIRRQMRRFASHEREQLARHQGEFNQYRVEIKTLIYAEFVFFICLAVFTFFFLRNSLFSRLSVLLNSVEKIKNGKVVSQAELQSNDEISLLMDAFVDLSYRVNQRERVLEFKAHHDELTGLKNRLALREDLETALEQLKQDKLALLFIDVNGLKTLNDSKGHDYGDALLCETACRLQASVRDTDVVYRIGGDEFIVLLKHIKVVSDVDRVLNKMHRSFIKPMTYNGTIVPLSASVGIAIAPDDASTAEALITFSDSAMYHAKLNGKAGFRYHRPS